MDIDPETGLEVTRKTAYEVIPVILDVLDRLPTGAESVSSVDGIVVQAIHPASAAPLTVNRSVHVGGTIQVLASGGEAGAMYRVAVQYSIGRTLHEYLFAVRVY